MKNLLLSFLLLVGATSLTTAATTAPSIQPGVNCDFVAMATYYQALANGALQLSIIESIGIVLMQEGVLLLSLL